MAIKIIKFDLPINGTKVTTLEALRDNLTDEIVQLARSGQLERWFKSRQLQEQAQAVAAAVASQAKDKALFLALCAALEVEVHPDDASAIFDAPPEAGQPIKGGKSFELCQAFEADCKKKQKLLDVQKNEVIQLLNKILEISNKYKNLPQPEFNKNEEVDDLFVFCDGFADILHHILDLLKNIDDNLPSFEITFSDFKYYMLYDCDAYISIYQIMSASKKLSRSDAAWAAYKKLHKK